MWGDLIVIGIVAFAYEGILTGSLEGVREVVRTLGVRLDSFGGASRDHAQVIGLEVPFSIVGRPTTISSIRLIRGDTKKGLRCY